jgi:alpha-tubulin suppressor-like RCC1 family protein
VATSGSAYCWGSTPNGAFGDGTVGTHLTPTPTAPGMTFQSIVAGSDFTCALTTAGAAYCWGLGPNGQLGNGASTNSTTPVPVSGGLTFRSLAAGGQAVCGLTTEGKAYCWGNNFYGTVGDGTSGMDAGPSRRPTPVAVAGGLTFETLSAGYATMCGVTASGAGYCWGYNFGAVGDGTSDHRSSPTAVAGALTFKRISSGTGYGCGVTTADAIYCWGENSNGGLGDGTIATRVAPVPVRWP